MFVTEEPNSSVTDSCLLVFDHLDAIAFRCHLLFSRE